MIEPDCLRRFVFASRDVRGAWAGLRQSWQEVLQRADYPAAVQRQLGEALAAAALLAATIKFKGALILQAQGDGPLRTLVAQASHDGKIRGWARHQPDVPDGDLASIYGQGHLVLTIQRENAEPYQGVVELAGKNLAQALELYFSRSEQLQTRIWLYADAEQARGLLLQELPGQQQDLHAWEHVQTLADTLTESELRDLPCETLLRRLFHEEQLRLFDAEPIAFNCGCSREKIADTLIGLGAEALEDILHKQEDIDVACEFCGQHYHFDKGDAEKLLDAARSQLASTTRH